MRRLLTFLFGFWAVAASAANGDYVGAQIASSGWELLVEFAGMNTNGTFNLGLGTNKTLNGNETVIVDLTSSGYDATGTATTRSRRLYGTSSVRFATTAAPFYPNVVSNATSTTVRIALSDFVYSGDTSLTVKLAAGLYNTNSVTSAAVNGLPVTNNSAITYGAAHVIGNWSMVPYQQINSNAATTYQVRVTAFHRHGIAAVKFWGQEGANITPTNIVTTPTIDSSQPDPVPVQEYVGTLYYTNLTQNNVVSNHFIVYPLIGDATSILTTTDAVNPEVSPYYHPLYLLCNKTNGFGLATAVVSVTNNSGMAGVVQRPGVFNPASPPLAFASFSQAARALADSNNVWFGYNMAAGIVYVRGGQHSFVGTAASPPTTQPPTWLVFTNYPGDGAINCAILDGTGNGDIQDRIATSGLYIQANASFVWSACSNTWWDKCIVAVTNSSADLLDGTFQGWATWNTVSNFDQGFRQQGSQNQSWALVRGNAIYGPNGTFMNCWTTIGNLAFPAHKLLLSSADSTTYGVNNQVLAFNQFYGITNGGNTPLSLYNSTQNLTNGAAIVQNVFEYTATNNASQALANIAADSSTGNVSNVLIWDNVMVGERTSIAYNDTGSAAAYRYLWSVKNNVFDDFNIKSDTFPTANAARVGNWPVLYGAGCSGNVWIEKANIGAPGSFFQESVGLNAYQPAITTSVPLGGATNITAFAAWLTDGSWAGSLATAGTGRGNYRVFSYSPLCLIRTENLTPYDAQTNFISGYGPPGVFQQASPRRGDFIGL